jgi:hypothetical protein
MTEPAPQYRKPAQPPTPGTIADRDRFEQLSDASLTNVQAAAEKWRTGLAAFVALVTGGLLIKGPESAQDLSTGWRLTLTLLGAAGLIAAIWGLWQALLAAAGTPRLLDYPSIVTTYGGIRQYEIKTAEHAASRLAWARFLVVAALALLLAATIAWWWAPKQQTKPKMFLSVEHAGNATCGKVVSGDSQHVRLRVAGRSRQTVIPFAEITNLYVVSNCGG